MYFSPTAHKSSVASAPVNNVSSFSSNSDNSLVSRACLAIYKANSISKSNLVLKDHSKSNILPGSIKAAIPVSVSNFYVYSFKSSSFTNLASQNSICYSKFSNPKIPTTPKSSISDSPTNRKNFSYLIPSVIKSNNTKPVCEPSQTSHFVPLPIKSSKCLFHSSTQACQSIFFSKSKGV